jgi:hypothetical protein
MTGHLLKTKNAISGGTPPIHRGSLSGKFPAPPDWVSIETKKPLGKFKKINYIQKSKKKLVGLTSEILILNKESVALAADSAATLSGEKIFKTNKIFMLSKFHPVGIMIYGNAHFMGIPWETIIKEYRRTELKDTKFNKLSDYSDNFTEFLRGSNSILVDQNNAEQNIEGRISSQLSNSSRNLFLILRSEIIEDIREEISFKSKISANKIKDITHRKIDRYETDLLKRSPPPSITDDDLKKLTATNRDHIEILIKNIFEELPVSEKIETLVDLSINNYIKTDLSDHLSGVVIVGYGEEEIFPSYQYFETIGIINNIFRCSRPKTDCIAFDCSARIVPFAIDDMVVRFMDGIDPKLQTFYEYNFSKIFQKYQTKLIDMFGIDANKDKATRNKLQKLGLEPLQEFEKITKNFIRNTYSDPILEIVKHLPKNELAEMAESLVNLTSFKRRVSTDVESVSGPIDVALISKGDGFVWVKRKHYFKAELNPQFPANYYREQLEQEIEHG